MFWYLLFAHLAADYPLQPNWMVMKKANLGVVILHVGVHIAVMLAVVGSVRQSVWPYLLALGGFHFLIDLAKNWLNTIRPGWVIGPYLVDQLIHYLTIWFVSAWIASRFSNLDLPLTEEAYIYLNGFLLVTYVWFISERILAYKDSLYRKEVVDQLWTRMLARAALWSGLLLIWRGLVAAPQRTAAVFSIPYLTGRYGTRALLTDVSVSLAGIIFVILAI